MNGFKTQGEENEAILFFFLIFSGEVLRVVKGLSGGQDMRWG